MCLSISHMIEIRSVVRSVSAAMVNGNQLVYSTFNFARQLA